MPNVGTITGSMVLDPSAYISGLNTAAGATRTFQTGVAGMSFAGFNRGMIASTTLMYAMGRVMSRMSKGMEEYSNILGRIGSVAELTATSMNILAESMKAVSVAQGVSRTDIMKGMYQAAQSRFTGLSELRGMAEKGASLSRSSGKEINVTKAVDLLATLRQSLGISEEAVTSGRVNDLLLRSRDVGRWELGQMAETVGKVSTVYGNQFGGPGSLGGEETLRQLLTIMSVGTLSGLPRNIVATGTRRMAERTYQLAISKRGDHLRKQLRGIGYESSDPIMEAWNRGPNEYLKDLVKMTGGKSSELFRLGYMSREQSTLTSVTRGMGGPMEETYQALSPENVKGTDARYNQRMRGTYDYARDRLRSQWMLTSQSFMQASIPLLSGFVDVLEGLNVAAQSLPASVKSFMMLISAMMSFRFALNLIGVRTGPGGAGAGAGGARMMGAGGIVGGMSPAASSMPTGGRLGSTYARFMSPLSFLPLRSELTAGSLAMTGLNPRFGSSPSLGVNARAPLRFRETLRGFQMPQGPSSGPMSAIPSSGYITGVQSSGSRRVAETSRAMSGLPLTGMASRPAETSGRMGGIPSSLPRSRVVESSGRMGGIPSSYGLRPIESSGYITGVQSSGRMGGVPSSGYITGIQSSGRMGGIPSSYGPRSVETSGYITGIQSSGRMGGVPSSLLRAGVQSSGRMGGTPSSYGVMGGLPYASMMARPLETSGRMGGIPSSGKIVNLEGLPKGFGPRPEFYRTGYSQNYFPYAGMSGRGLTPPPMPSGNMLSSAIMPAVSSIRSFGSAVAGAIGPFVAFATIISAFTSFYQGANYRGREGAKEGGKSKLPMGGAGVGIGSTFGFGWKSIGMALAGESQYMGEMQDDYARQHGYIPDGKGSNTSSNFGMYKKYALDVFKRGAGGAGANLLKRLLFPGKDPIGLEGYRKVSPNDIMGYARDEQLTPDQVKRYQMMGVDFGNFETARPHVEKYLEATNTDVPKDWSAYFKSIPDAATKGGEMVKDALERSAKLLDEGNAQIAAGNHAREMEKLYNTGTERMRGYMGYTTGTETLMSLEGMQSQPFQQMPGGNRKWSALYKGALDKYNAVYGTPRPKYSDIETDLGKLEDGLGKEPAKSVRKPFSDAMEMNDRLRTMDFLAKYGPDLGNEKVVTRDMILGNVGSDSKNMTPDMVEQLVSRVRGLDYTQWTQMHQMPQAPFSQSLQYGTKEAYNATLERPENNAMTMAANKLAAAADALNTRRKNEEQADSILQTLSKSIESLKESMDKTIEGEEQQQVSFVSKLRNDFAPIITTPIVNAIKGVGPEEDGWEFG